MSRRAPARWLAELTGLPIREAHAVGAQHGYQHLMLTLADGRRAFAKAIPPEDPTHRPPTTPHPPPDPAPPDPAAALNPAAARSDWAADPFAAEANRQRWLA